MTGRRLSLRRVVALKATALALVGSSGLADAAFAQVQIDGTTPTTLNASNGVTTVDGGVVAGGNQFHSFSAFSVGAGDTVDFAASSAGAIENVISRVTGGAVSAIDGALRVSAPGANFFLINPNGVSIGSGAVIDVPGAFHISTADELRFADGLAFSATGPNGSAFSVSAPESFGFLGSNAGIDIAAATISGAGGSLSASSITMTDASIAVDAGGFSAQTVGGLGSVSLDGAVDGLGGALSVSGGAIEATGGAIRLRSGETALIGGAEVAARSMDGVAGSGAVEIAGVDNIRVDGATLRSTIGGAEPNAADVAIATLDPNTGLPTTSSGALTLNDARLTNANAGALSATAGAVLIDGRLRTNRFDIAAASVETTQRSNWSVVEGATPLDFRLRIEAASVDLEGDIIIDEAACLAGGDCFALGPELAIVGDDVRIAGPIDVVSESFRQTNARPAVSIAGATVAFEADQTFGRGDDAVALPTLIQTSSIDGVAISGGAVDVSDTTFAFTHQTLREDAFGLSIEADGLAMTNAGFSVNVAGDVDACAGGFRDCTLTGLAPVKTSSLRATVEGDATLDNVTVTMTTFEAPNLGDFTIDATGDVAIANLFATQSSAPPEETGVREVFGREFAGDGGMGAFVIRGDAVRIEDSAWLALGNQPTPDESEAFSLPSLMIDGRTVDIENTLLSLGSGSFQSFIDLVIAANDPGLAAFLEARLSALASLEDTSPAGAATIRADETATLVGSTISTRGAPNEDVATNDGSIDISAGGALTLLDTIVETDISTGGADLAAGSISLSGSDILIRDADQSADTPTSVTATASDNDASAGGVTIASAGALTIEDAVVSASAERAAGPVLISAEEARVLASEISAEVDTGAVGAGSISVAANSFFIGAASVISTEADEGAAGDISIIVGDADPIVLEGGSITTTSNNDDNSAGAIAIRETDGGAVEGIVLIDGLIRALGGDDAGFFDIDESRLVLDNASEVLVGEIDDPFNVVGNQSFDTERRTLDTRLRTELVVDACAQARSKDVSQLGYRSNIGLRVEGEPPSPITSGPVFYTDADPAAIAPANDGASEEDAERRDAPALDRFALLPSPC